MTSLILRNCYLCHTPGCPSSVDVGLENAERFQRFLVLITRYLNFSPTGCSKPKDSLNRENFNLSELWSDTHSIHFCQECVAIMASFCSMYNEWFNLKLEMNKCLEKVTSIFRSCENFNLQQLQIAREDAVTGETFKGPSSPQSMNIREFEKLEFLVKQVEEHLRQAFPRINLSRLEVTPSTALPPHEHYTFPIEENYSPRQLKIEREVDTGADDLIEVDYGVETDFADDMVEPVEMAPEEIEISPELFFENANSMFADIFQGGHENNQKKRRKEGTGHLQNDNLGKAFKCLHCDKCFDKQNSLKKHEKLHLFPHADFPPQSTQRLINLTCVFCGKPLRDWYKLENHLRTHTKERPYSCEVCEKSFAEPNTLKKHASIHVRMNYPRPPPVVTKCLWCSDRDFRSLSHLHNHIRTHIREKPFPCQSCQKTFADSSTLRKHERVHLEFKLLVYQCSQCGKQFSLKESLVSHMKIHDAGDEKPYQCDECGKCFAMKTYLLTHVTRHLEVKPEHCSICQKRFTHKKDVVSHIRQVHTKEASITCRICGEGFSSWGTRKRHEINKHTGKLHVCKYCGRAFGEARDRNKHEYTRHEKVKVPRKKKPIDESYHCRVCMKFFNTRRKGTSHERKVHKIKAGMIPNMLQAVPEPKQEELVETFMKTKLL